MSNEAIMDKMQYILAAIGLFFTVCIGIAKFNRDGWKNRYQTYLDFAVAFDKDKPNKFLIEQLFSSITKCHNAAYHEIWYLMNSTNPTQTISNFSRIRKNGCFFSISENGFAMYSDEYDSPKKRHRRCIVNIVAFIFLYVFAIIAPVHTAKFVAEWISDKIPLAGHNVAIIMTAMFLVSFICFLLLACIRLISATIAILKSNEFMKEFNCN